MNVHPSKIPWSIRRSKCKICHGVHATWWGKHVKAPSCRPGKTPSVANDMVMFLETQRVLGL